MSKFPNEKILDNLFQFLSIKELRVVKRVNKSWLKAASQIEHKRWNTNGQIVIFDRFVIDVQKRQVIYSVDMPSVLLKLRDRRHTVILTHIPYKYQVF